MSPIELSVPGSRPSTAGKSSSLASSKFTCLAQLASPHYCQAEYASNNAVIVSDSTRNTAINSFDVDMTDASGTVLASTEDKKDETGNTGKRSGSATNKTSGSPERDYVCDTCNRIFTRKYSLKRHIKTMHNHGSLPFKCDSCNAAFSRRDMLDSHKGRVHSNNPLPFKCDSCQKTFSSISTLNRHTKSLHSDTDTMVVGCDVCGKTFRRNDCLIRHKRVHSGNKPFECEICHKKFAYKQNRNIHQTKCKQGPKYECNKSGEKFPGKMTTVWADSFFRHRTL